MQTRLLVTIDTEEDDAWTAGFRADGHTVENTRGIERFQTLCDRYQLRPTYLIDTPIVDDQRSVELLASLQSEDRCEVAAHLHPWCAPPIEGQSDQRQSFMCNLPLAMQREKLNILTETIEQRIGRRPTAFRAGRYGLDMAGARILAELGYDVDSSVIPFTDYSAQGGPDFSTAPHQPYFLDGDNLTRPHPQGFLLEVPVTVGYNRVNFARSHRIRTLASGAVLGRMRMVGILDRLGLVRRIKLSPEQAGVSEMKTLVDVCLAQNAPCVVLMFHSASLIPGGSPYVGSEDDLDEFHRRLNAIFEHCVTLRGMASDTLSGFARKYVAEVSATAA